MTSTPTPRMFLYGLGDEELVCGALDEHDQLFEVIAGLRAIMRA